MSRYFHRRFDLKGDQLESVSHLRELFGSYDEEVGATVYMNIPDNTMRLFRQNELTKGSLVQLPLEAKEGVETLYAGNTSMVVELYDPDPPAENKEGELVPWLENRGYNEFTPGNGVVTRVGREERCNMPCLQSKRFSRFPGEFE